MGIYVSFWHGAGNGLAGHFLQLPHAEFEAWLHEALTDYPDDFDPDIMPLLRDFRRYGYSALVALSPEQAITIDNLFGVCYGHWLDGATQTYKEAANRSLVALRRFDTIEAALTQSHVPGSIQELWRHLSRGRPFLRDPVRLPWKYYDVFRLGYWTRDEIKQLHPWIKNVTGVDSTAQAAAVDAMSSALERKSGLILMVG
jgi:hypothetical protein